MKLGMAGRARCAFLLWFVMGTFLVWRGLGYREAAGDSAALALAIGVAVGVAKGLTVLRRSSRRILARIEAQPGKASLFSAFPPILALLIPLMIGFGWSLRHFYGESHPALVLAVYTGIGAALVASSIPMFIFARRH
jgi:hypothetical protein